MAKRTGGFIGQDGINAPDQATGVAGAAGDASVSVSFTSPSNVGGAAITGYNVVANDGSRASGFSSSSYTDSSFSTNSQDTAPVDIKFKSNGTRMFILGTQNRSVYEYELSSAYDVTTATYTDAFSVAAQATGGYGLFFKSDGTSFYIADIDSETVYQYNCSTAWDISTASYASKSFSVSSQSTDPRGLWFKSDGTKMYVGPSGTTDAIFQYSLSTAWDISTASYDSVSLDVTAQESFVRAIGINSDGTKLYVIGNADAVYEYSLPTAYVLTNGAYTGGNIDLSSQETAANGFAFNGSENKFYINGTGSDTVFEYNFGQYPTASPVTVTGLTNGTSYTFNVWAINPFGWSSPSDASGGATPSGFAFWVGGATSGDNWQNVIQKASFATLGNASDWGDLTVARGKTSGCSSATRGLAGGGRSSGGDTNVIDYYSLSTSGNALDFGDLVGTVQSPSALANSTRGVFGGGESGAKINTMQYVTIASTGNTTDFGDLLLTLEKMGSAASPTRGLFAGGFDGGTATDVIQYITIASTGNATDFGDLTVASNFAGGASNSTRALFTGGLTIDFVTIATTGNATDFGDLLANSNPAVGAASGTRALFGSGGGIQYVEIASTGNAVSFGNLTFTQQSSETFGSGSTSHGGL